jgi:Mu-like prophage major head subunit gpT
MAGVITTGSHPKALWPGINAWWGQSYQDWPEEWSKLVDKFTSNKHYEEDVQLVGFGLVPTKAEGAGIIYDSEIQGPVSRYTHVTYGMGYIVTQEEQEDNLYVEVSKRRSAHLARAFRLTKENVVANIYNRAFTSGYTGGDGVVLLSTAHPNTSGGTWQNKMTVDADLSQAALEDMLTLIGQSTDDRGNQISLMPRSLVVSINNWWNANRILKSAYTPGSANNDINVINATNALPEGIVLNHYLTSTTNWFIRTNCPEGLKLFERVAISFDQDNDFDTYNLKAKSRERYSAGWTDPRALFGSNAP